MSESETTTWRDEIKEAVGDVPWEGCYPPEDSGIYDQELPAHSAGAGERFTVWTADRVVFPVESTRGLQVASVPRNPSEDATYL